MQRRIYKTGNYRQTVHCPEKTGKIVTLKGKQITSDWPKMIYHEWMPGSGYQEAHRFMFQLYDQRFKGLDHLDVSVLDAYVPVK